MFNVTIKQSSGNPNSSLSSSLLACLHDQNKSGFFPAYQSFLKVFQIALIGWVKVGTPKKPLMF